MLGRKFLAKAALMWIAMLPGACYAEPPSQVGEKPEEVTPIERAADARSEIQAGNPVSIGQAVFAGADDDFYEVFDEYSNVSGSPLVGLSLGNSANAFSASGVLFAGPKRDVTFICVRLLSLDGRLETINPYEVATMGEKIAVAPVAMKQIEAAKSYANRNELAFLAYDSSNKDCSSKESIFLPQVGSDSQFLRLQINAEGRQASVALADVDGEMLTEWTKCEKPDALGLVAFDRECVVDLFGIDASSEASEIWLRLRDGIYGDELMKYKIQLSP